ncbi:sugar O-acetyltransferase [Lactococcus fujiensis]|uniref:Acetyltransferase n=1 Tax=Lactococcus fujiensis JCM 16395 TaxID=1291764 RepID=A0A2A5RPI5_9LACT|nr:sugar O-acetyltransferase [Lactococcus fujiensis]PCS01355.1 maltose O-acetyltransferase [Lactococcus fujiensis JCM 16395]
MTEYEKMISGNLYRASKIDAEHSSKRGRALADQINKLARVNTDEIVSLERDLLGKSGAELFINPPLYVDYGFNIEVGENFYANMDCIFLDVAPIIFGDDVMVGPRVNFITATHPLDAGVRVRGLELGQKITIGNRVWIGAAAVINPGVTIGDNVIIGSGAVVTKDIPAGVIAVGNPARILRKLTEEDRLFWEKKERDYYEVDD